MRPAGKEVIAVVASDLHLRLRAPVSREEKEDWLAVQEGYLRQLYVIGEETGAAFIYPGDIFDRYNSGPELVNFAIKYLPRGYAIPGQHDLPHHRYEDIKKSAYWTLVEAGILIDLKYAVPIECHKKFYLYGFPWNHDLIPPETSNGINVAVIHRYVWKKGHSYPGAPEQSYFKKLWKSLKGYDVTVVGDNHRGFLVQNQTTGQYLLNCGGFYRAKSDEKDYKPAVGLIHSDGSVSRKFLNVSSDKWEDLPVSKTAEEAQLNVEDFLEMLNELGDTVLDFGDAVKEYLDKNKVGEGVRRLILKLMEG